MDDLLPLCRQAFRTLHGLPPAGAMPLPPPETRSRLAAWAQRHRVMGLLQAGWPETEAAKASAVYGQAQHAARCTHEAERLFARLSPDLPALTLMKGPALAAQAWTEPGLRSFDDLDFRCSRADFPAFAAGMKEAGYAPEVEDPRRLSHLWHYGWGVAFRHPNGFMVEVNHRFFPPQYPWPGFRNRSWKNSFANQKLEDAEVCAPTPALHLLLGCLHAVWHGWARLAWLADIAGLLARHPGILPQAQALAARGPFAEKALAAGCGVAEAIFGPGLSDFPLPPTPQARVAEALVLLNGTARPLGGRELRRLHEQFMTPAEKSAYRLRRVATPGDGDFRWISLPPALRGLYWLIRPVRAALYETGALRRNER